MTFYGNYGRGIASQTLAACSQPDAPKISTTDFYQTGTSYNTRRFSATGSFFFIDRSNEQVYIPDDGSIEFAGRSRSYGVEAKTSVKNQSLFKFQRRFDAGFEAFYPGEFFRGEQLAPPRLD
jgi:hypothetical protein